MIKVTALYAYDAGKRFDIDYYRDKHIPMVKGALGAACKGVSLDIGLSGRAPDSAPPFAAMAHMLFDSLEAFRAAIAPHAARFSGDAPNYTDIAPLMQISKVE